MNFKILFIMFIIYAFIGWLLEIIYTYVMEKKIINRGFLIGPYCPIYGVGCLLLIFLLNSFNNNFLLLFLISVIICSILEYFTSYIMEKIFKARWWDYSNKKFNLNGRICLDLMFSFGILGSLVTHFLNPYIVKKIISMPNDLLSVLFYVLFVFFVIDFFISCGIISKVSLSSKKINMDNTEEITKKVKEYIMNNSKLGKRLLKSFPNLKIKTNKRKNKSEKKV